MVRGSLEGEEGYFRVRVSVEGKWVWKICCSGYSLKNSIKARKYVQENACMCVQYYATS